MKIALVHSFYSGNSPSGENIVVEAQCKALLDRGIDVRIIGTHTDDLTIARGYKLRAAAKVATGYGASPLKALQAFNPDVVHVHNLFPNWATWWLKQWKGPLVATVHNYRPVCASGTLFRDGNFCDRCPSTGSHNAVVHGCYKDSKVASVPLAIQNIRGVSRNPLLARADRIVVLSERAQDLYESFGLDGAKLSYIPNFVDDLGFMPSAALGPYWAYVGRLSEEKGILELLRHWPDNHELRIFGDGRLRRDVEAFCRQNIRLEGAIDRGDVPTALGRARGLIFPSLTPEGAVPLTYVEALAAARPTLSKEGNGAADDIRANGTGLVFEQWAELGQKLDEMNMNIAETSTRARQHYLARYTTSRWADATICLYEELLTAV
jgi:glycosyltransferase involved in cell wall biosynthesis